MKKVILIICLAIFNNSAFACDDQLQLQKQDVCQTLTRALEQNPNLLSTNPCNASPARAAFNQASNELYQLFFKAPTVEEKDYLRKVLHKVNDLIISADAQDINSLNSCPSI
ncbi:MAG: hypothetical protein ACXVCY_15105 [Pseudobdellovibrionaceae bacterium]